MADLTEGIQNALIFIEANLTEDLEVREIASGHICRPSIFRESSEPYAE